MKILLFNFNCILDGIADELKKRGHSVTELSKTSKLNLWQKYDVIVVWNETQLAGWRDFIKLAKNKGKKVILVQHGRRGTSRIYPPFNEELISDLVCVWGENDKKRLMSVGVPENKIKITGTPIFKHLKPKVKHKGINVVFSPEHWDIDVAENQVVAGVLRKIKGINIITKVLEHEHLAIYDNPVVSNRTSPGHLDICTDVLSKADLVVSISESTFELMAEMLDIPVVIADIWVPKACGGDDKYKEYNREYSNACLREKDINRLPKTIEWYLKHPQYLRKERKEISKLDGGDTENSLKNICDVIEGKSYRGIGDNK